LRGNHSLGLFQRLQWILTSRTGTAARRRNLLLELFTVPLQPFDLDREIFFR
jgi:hypothetical protein